LNAQVRPAIVSFLTLTALTGLAYPILLGCLARMAFPEQAGGSLIRRNGRVVGSMHIGQAFSGPGDFWGRPSATTTPYDAANSGASNLSPGNPEWLKSVAARAAALQAADPEQPGPIPVDLVTASGSDLDPDISPEAAAYQAHRVAKARGLGLAQVQALVAGQIDRPQLAVLGEARVNVLKLNLALDAMQGK